VPYPTHTYNAAGFYSICLTITDSAGCSDTYCNPYFLLKAEDESSAMIQVNVYPPTFTGAHQPELEKIMLYPNPTDGAVTLKAEGIFGKATFKLLDSMGKELSQQTVQGNELGQGVGVDLSQLSSGLYFLKIQTEEGNHFMKVVKH